MTKKNKKKIICTKKEKPGDSPLTNCFQRLVSVSALSFFIVPLVRNTVSGSAKRRTKFIHPKIGYTMILVHIISLSAFGESFRRRDAMRSGTICHFHPHDQITRMEAREKEHFACESAMNALECSMIRKIHSFACYFITSSKAIKRALRSQSK